uniref:Transcription factor IIIB 50 kDa subunit n=1 Tax=Sinocyclocheilus grahami TaxID=75366 RepID=A0A672KDY0_SINGR
MPSSCPECGSSNVVEDDLYSQRQWVCVDCGSVVSEGHLTTTVSDETQGRGNQARDTSLSSDLSSVCLKTAGLTSTSFVLSSCALSCFHRGVKETV